MTDDTTFPPDVLLDGIATPDGIEPVTAPGTPPGFDLVAIMSESLSSRPAYGDLAIAASKILYQYCEMSRIALQLSRSPENIARVFKVSLAKMLGMDWNSPSLSDDDYDRMINSLADYEQGHGPPDFARYLGFCLGVPMDLIYLWTKDYKTFVPGPDFKLKGPWDNPPGPYYPTTHVGILYELLSQNAGLVDVGDIETLFYKLAPINLVLDWVLGEISLGVGSLAFAFNSYVVTDRTVVAPFERPLGMGNAQREFDTSEDTLLIYPLAPYNLLNQGIMVCANEIGIETAITLRPSGDWDPFVVHNYALTSIGDENLILSKDRVGGVRLVREPCSQWIGRWPNQIGALINPSSVGIIPNSNNPNLSWKTNSAGTTISPSVQGAFLAYKVVTTQQTPIRTLGIASGTHVFMWTLQYVSGSALAAIQRGGDLVVFDIVNRVAYPTLGAGSSACGIIDEGGGWCSLWAVMSGDDIDVYPAWGESMGLDIHAANTILWYNLQAETRSFPTVPFYSRDSVPFAHAASTFDLSMHVPTHIPTIPNPAEPVSIDQLNYVCGFAMVEVIPTFNEWVSATPTLIDFRNLHGDGVFVTLNTDGFPVFITRFNYSQTWEAISTHQAVPGEVLRIGFSWNEDTSSVRLMTNNWYQDAPIAWPTNFYSATIGRAYGQSPVAQLVLTRVLVEGLTDPSKLPSHALLSWMFNHFAGVAMPVETAVPEIGTGVLS